MTFAELETYARAAEVAWVELTTLSCTLTVLLRYGYAGRLRSAMDAAMAMKEDA